MNELKYRIKKLAHDRKNAKNADELYDVNKNAFRVGDYVHTNKLSVYKIKEIKLETAFFKCRALPCFGLISEVGICLDFLELLPFDENTSVEEIKELEKKMKIEYCKKYGIVECALYEEMK